MKLAMMMMKLNKVMAIPVLLLSLSGDGMAQNRPVAVQDPHARVGGVPASAESERLGEIERLEKLVAKLTSGLEAMDVTAALRRKEEMFHAWQRSLGDLRAAELNWSALVRGAASRNELTGAHSQALLTARLKTEAAERDLVDAVDRLGVARSASPYEAGRLRDQVSSVQQTLKVLRESQAALEALRTRVREEIDYNRLNRDAEALTTTSAGSNGGGGSKTPAPKKE